jgi:hypothetical protein
MMKKITLILLLISNLCFAQQKALNIPGLLQLVGYSKSEYALQVTAKNRQAQVLANEEANKILLVKLKGTYRSLQQRYNLLGTAISAADIGFQATPMLHHIISTQQQIITLAYQNPLILPMALETETEFAGHSNSLVHYLIGLCLSLGDVNQMKASDRRILFDYVLSELSSIEELSQTLLTGIQNANIKIAVNPVQDWVSTDKQLAAEIIQNAKALRR